MTSDEKKAFLLLKSVIFHYHGLDEDEQGILDETAAELNAQAELQWANAFIEEDYFNAFDRAREFLRTVGASLDKGTKLQYITQVWQSNEKKGYISEMEAMAILRVAEDWHIEKELISMIKM
jgi:nucleoside phosphorylase